MTEARRKDVDMSSDAIDQRLKEVAALYRLGVSIGKAKRIGLVEKPAPEAAGDRRPRSD